MHIEPPDLQVRQPLKTVGVTVKQARDYGPRHSLSGEPGRAAYRREL